MTNNIFLSLDYDYGDYDLDYGDDVDGTVSSFIGSCTTHPSVIHVMRGYATAVSRFFKR